jgi:hypothetical protein
MVLAFLKSEWDRWNLAERADVRLISEPDLADPIQNRARLVVLKSVRRLLLDRIPPDTRWFEVRHLASRHFWQLRNIHRSDWSRHSATNDLLYMARSRPERLRQEADAWGCQRPILWGHNRSGPFTIIEGNHRLTAIAGAPLARQENIKMISYVGISARPCEWHRLDGVS